MGIMGDILDSLIPDPVEDFAGDVVGGVGNAIGNTYQSLPSPVQGALGTGLGVVGGVLDAPRGAVASGIGNLDYWTANLRHKIGLEDDTDMANIRRAYEEGGGRGVWEDEIIADVDNPLLRGLIDVAIDPLTWAGAGVITNVGRGMQGAGRVIGAADNLSTGQRALGAGLRGAGKATEVTGQVLRKPDDLIFDPMMRGVGRVGKKTIVDPVKWSGRSVATHTPERIREPLSSLSERARERTLSRIAHWKELTPEAQLNVKVNKVTRAVQNLFVKDDPQRPSAAWAGEKSAEMGTTTAYTAAGDERAGMFDWRPTERVKKMRNDSYRTPAVRRYLEPAPPDATGMQQSWMDRAKDIWARNQSLGITPSGTTGSITQPQDMLQASTNFGPTTVWRNAEERDTFSRAAAEIIIERAGIHDGTKLRGVEFAIKDLQGIKKEFLRQNPQVSELWPDIYRRASEMIKEQTGVNMPAVSMAGRKPLTGSVNMERATEADVNQYVENYATGLVQMLRRGGLAREFQVGGRFYEDGGSLRDLAQNGLTSEDGLQLATFDEFYTEFSREFGDIDLQQAEDLYKLGIDRFRDDMIFATSPANIGKVKTGADTMDFKGDLLINREGMEALVKAGYSGKDFYSQGVKELASMFESKSDFDLYLKILSVTSSNTPVKMNVDRAMDAWVQYKAGNRDALKTVAGFTDEQVDQLGRTNFVQQLNYPGQRDDVDQLLAQGDIDTQKLSSFFGNFQEQVDIIRQREAYDPLMNPRLDPDSVLDPAEQLALQNEVVRSMELAQSNTTVDLWATRASGIKSGQPNRDQFQRQGAMMKAMSNRSWEVPNEDPRLTNLSPSDIQAASWAGIKKKAGYELADFGSDLGNNAFTVKNIQDQGARNMSEYVDMRVEPMVREWMQKTEASVREVLGRAESSDSILWYPTMTRTQKFETAPRPKKGQPKPADKFLRDEQGRRIERPMVPAGTKRDKRVHVISHSIDLSNAADPVQDATADLMYFKLRMDETFGEAWNNTRVVLDNTGDGTLSVDVFYYPEQTDSKIMARFQKAQERRMTMANDTDDQFAEAQQFMRRIEGINRGNRLATKPLVGNEEVLTSDRVAAEVASLAKRMQQDPEFYGSSFKLKPGGYLEEFDGPVNPDGSPMFPVSLGSAGESGKFYFDEGETIQQATKQFMEEMEPVINGPYNDMLFIGVFRDTDETGREFFTLDLNIGARDAVEAEKIGAITNQVAYFDPNTFESVPLQRGTRDSNSPFKTAEQVEELLDAITDARYQGGDIEEIIPVGSRSPESSGFLPTGGEAADAFLDMYDRSRLRKPVRQALDLVTGDKAPTQAEIRAESGYDELVMTNMAEIDDAVETSSRPYWLSDEENSLLYETAFEDGETIGAYAERLIETIGTDNDTLNRMGITWSDGMSLKAKKALTDDEYIQDIIERWHELGLRPGFDDRAAVSEAVQRRLVKESGIDPSKRTIYDKVKAIWGEFALASPRYVLANVSTNILDSMISGHWNFNAASEVADMFRYAAADMSGVPIGKIAQNTKYGELMVKYGLGDTPELFGLGARSSIDTVKRGSQYRKVAEKLKIGWTAKGVEAPLALAQGVDNVRRVAVFEDAMESSFEMQRKDLLAKMDAILEKQVSENPAKYEHLYQINMLPSYDPVFIKSYMKKKGFTEGRAEALARAVANARNKAVNDGLKEADRIFLNYQKTNLDAAVGKIIPFHYWASRKVRYYAEEAYRNPALAANYFRAQAGIERVQEDPGLSARQKGFLRLMSGPTGFTLLMNPDALMGVIKATGLNDTYSPDGETEVGALIQKLKSNGVGLYPWIDGALNMMGVYGDTFSPDMLGIRHRGLVGSIVNWMRSEGFMGEAARQPGADPYADLNLEAREKLSSWVSTFAPDWLTSPVEVNAGGATTDATLEHIIQSRIIAENPDITNQELIALMNDPDSEAYQSAFQDAARAGVIQQMLSFTSPFSFRVEENTRDVRSAAKQVISEKAEELGIMPHEVTNSSVDAEFRAEYKNKTGEQFTVDSWATKDFENDLTRATPEGRRFVVYENEYNQIGGKEGRMVMNDYNDYRSGVKAPPGYRGTNILNETPEMRQFLADRWLNASGSRAVYEETLAMRRSYREKHPEFGQFKDWQGQMYDLQSLLGGSLAEYRRQVARQNPSAARYFADQIEWMQQRGVRPEDMEAELDRVTLNTNAYFAINGLAKTQFDPARGPDTVGMGDPLQSMSAPYMNGPYPQMPSTLPEPTPGGDWTQILAQYAR